MIRYYGPIVTLDYQLDNGTTRVLRYPANRVSTALTTVFQDYRRGEISQRETAAIWARIMEAHDECFIAQEQTGFIYACLRIADAVVEAVLKFRRWKDAECGSERGRA